MSHKKSVAAILLSTTVLGVPAHAESMKRLATVPLDAEVTGLFEVGSDLFFNIQHPNKEIGNEFAKAAVGVIANADWDAAAMEPTTEDADKKVVRSSLGDYQVLLQEGDEGIVGVIKSLAGEDLLVSNDPDFNAYVPTGDNEGYLFTNWENRPGGMSRAKIMRAEDGTWSVDTSDLIMIDFSAVDGTLVNCFGTLSPWGTPLTSEELYFDDTVDWNNPEYKYIDDNQVLANYLGEGKYPNPYDYGYIVEITDPAGAATPVKHMALGRFSHENAVVMPDNKTVYLSDDGSSVVFFKFVADAENDLSAGTLYAAKVTQEAGAQADAATTGFGIEWIELGHASNDEIAAWVAEYDGIDLEDHVPGETNYITDEEVAAFAAGEAADARVAFLESRRAAVALGATGEFNKMEGVNINYDAAKDGSVPFMYMAMSDVSKAMSDGEGAIDVAENVCGVVYEMELDANYDVSMMVPVVAGYGYDKDAEANACPMDSVANPDNILVRANGQVVIGEDSGNHENNVIWLWNRDSQS
ncbi:PhoX family protein [Tropicimonas aquimaris]|uniref:Alkaline phosphatase PhoX n=1 Tax=Tropicimonas aquimaris TaxID=914152 RepID=A0ABW3ITC2_9RHOB